MFGKTPHLLCIIHLYVFIVLTYSISKRDNESVRNERRYFYGDVT